MSGHYGTVDVAGSASAPGGFVWRCQCGARSIREHSAWDDAETEHREHQEWMEGRA